MRYVIAFVALAGLWLVAGEYEKGGDRFADIRRFFLSESIDDNAPNWGDVAAKIGELAHERGALTTSINPVANAGAAIEERPIPAPTAKPR